MNAGIPTKCLRVAVLLSWFVMLCGFEGSGNGPVLELHRPAPPVDSMHPPEPPSEYPEAAPFEYNDPAGSIPSGPDLRFHQFLKFYGCWASIVTPKELTDFTNSGSGVLSHWADRRYTICFARDLSGELQPNMSQEPADGEKVKDLMSSTEVSGYDDQVVSLINLYTFMYSTISHDASTDHWYNFGRSPKPVEIQQVTNLSCVRDGVHLICAARVNAKCKGENCYSFSWKAKFHGSSSTAAHSVEAPE
jgi:hypothetical protein